MKIKEFHIDGLSHALDAMRMPYLSNGKSREDDINLACKLIKAGTEHRKFMRQFIVTIDMDASMAFWFEWDTYKICVTNNSESFWNTISREKELNMSQFVIPEKPCVEFKIALEHIIKIINKYWKNEDVPKEIIRYLIPQGVKYRRIVTLSGEALLNIIKQRQNHRLKEWQEFIAACFRSMLPNERRLFELALTEENKFKY